MTPQEEDRRLLTRLRAMWERRDPVPDGLARSVLAVLATEGLDEEYAMLTLVASTDRLAGVRGGVESRTLTFGSGEVTVMLRVSPLGDRRRRLDGWITPSAAYDVRLDRRGAAGEAGELRTTSTPLGRFEIADVAAGTVTLRLLAVAAQVPADDGVAPLWLTTPPLTL
ncbi:hypothetical protein [Cellulomonas phragmiteti]|uniref:Uncharacterized protein n=1 Tax=Cellulomonas phragmiteti TaxID=478780 RepID=A0ABQ4DIL6_9CELL|nr:hypothetical protein [Cellulomonas phragmiteti]GIG39196.1 hypothetical protein Cph01nite_09580 [Cellulomonas phragmiteti]